NLAQDVLGEAVDIAGVALRLPKRLDGLINRLEDGSLSVGSHKLERQVARLDRVVRRIVWALVFGALLIAGAILRADDAVFGTVLMAVSVVPLLYVLLARRGN
ncbi:MAG: AarF/ABC1/UbiB kinase family protein, partial [Glaciihabitans sp.]|nr:AarF/ABC1/UbiB kinase family protein [Glaciihabitans sp.]